MSKLKSWSVERDGQSTIVQLRQNPTGYTITINERLYNVDTHHDHSASGSINISIDGQRFWVPVSIDKNQVEVEVRGERSVFDVHDPRKKALQGSASGSGGLILSKMSGRVVEILCEPGSTVEKGQNLLIVEAMKMENPVKALCAGVISQIFVENGQIVEAKEKLLELTADAEEH